MDVNIVMQIIARKVFLKTVNNMMLILRYYAEKFQKMIQLQKEK